MVNRLLDRKLRRELRRHLGSLVAIAIVVACGVASFVAMRSMVRVLGDAQRDYYRTSRFPDVFVQVRRAPDAILDDLRAIPGVARLEARTTGEVTLRLAGRREPATARIVGVRPPAAGALNLLTLRAGRLPADGEDGAIVVSEGFARANAIAPGDRLGAIIGARWRDLHVTGIAVTAEFVYEFRAGDMLPDPERYGVIWMDADAAAAAFGHESAWNELGLTLAPGASEAAVIAALDERLARYGTYGAYGREQHASHRFLTEEIRQNRTFAMVLPLIFLGVAAFLVNLVLGRVVSQQRDQVGTLKAFGMPMRTLVRHYTLFALTPVVAGTALGTLVGTRIADYLAEMYLEFFRFPELRVRFYPMVFAFAAGLGVIAALLGALGALRRLLAMPPAEAMRPEPPAIYAHGVAERLVGRRLRSPVSWLVLRGLVQRPWRTALSAFGIGLGASVVVVGTFGFDSIAHMRHVLFGVATTADVTVTFGEPQGMPAVHSLARLPGVERVEPVREAAVRVRHGHRSRQTALVGVDPSARLRTPARIDGARGRVVPGGVTLSHTLSRVLAAGVGDTVDITFLDGFRRRVSLPVSGTIDDLSGASLYVDADLVATLAGVGESIPAADIAVSPGMMDSLYARLTQMPGVRTISVRRALQRSFDDTLRRNFVVILTTLIAFASALAAGTVYNAGRVALSERTRDLASMRVLGFTRGEVARVLFGELASLGALGLPLGVLVGCGFAWATVASFGNTELFRMPLVIGPRTLAAGFVIPAVAAAMVAYPLRRRLDRLDLISVLKTRE